MTAPVDVSGTGEATSILSKAFDLLYAFNKDQRVMTLSQLARASGLPKSTVHRLLARLVDLGALEHHRSGYKLGLGLLQLGVTTPASNMRDLAMPYLVALQRWTGQTVTFAVLRDLDVVYLERVAPLDGPFSQACVGARLPANCTAIGKALLAHEDLDRLAASLPQRLPGLTQHSITRSDQFLAHLRITLKDGIAHEREETEVGVCAIGRPVIVGGFAVGAIAVSYPRSAPPGGRAEAALRHATGRLSAYLTSYLAGEGSREQLLPRTISDPALWEASKKFAKQGVARTSATSRAEGLGRQRPLARRRSLARVDFRLDEIVSPPIRAQR
jgi:DNA-binding IclR family transcriptional regulator